MNLFNSEGLRLVPLGLGRFGGVSMFAQVNRQAVEACWARTRDGLRLSDRIWQKGDQLRRTMWHLIQEAMAVAQDAVTTAKGIRWVLSKAHSLPDICDDDLAAHDEGLGEGVYAPRNQPPYPAHPNCLCHLVPVHDQPEEFVERLKRWRDNPESEPALEKWYN